MGRAQAVAVLVGANIEYREGGASVPPFCRRPATSGAQYASQPRKPVRFNRAMLGAVGPTADRLLVQTPLRAPCSARHRQRNETQAAWLVSARREPSDNELERDLAMRAFISL